MKQLAYLEISSFLWDIDHFNDNKPSYYQVMTLLSNLYEEILTNNIKIIIRQSLCNEIYLYFPYDIIPNDFYEFQMDTFYFLSNVSMAGYSNEVDSSILSSPNLVKEFYQVDTKSEIDYLINYLHKDNIDNKGVLTFKLFWGEFKNLELSNSHTVEIETFLCDELKAYRKIISKFKKIFEHNSKHDEYKTNAGGDHNDLVSPLSCYNERLKDTREAQSLLDNSIELNGSYFSYDINNKTYVKFVPTIENIFHGFDISLTKEEEIKFLRKKYNK